MDLRETRFQHHPNIYLITTALLTSFCSIFFGVLEYERVFPNLIQSYILLKIALSTIGLAFSAQFYFGKANDISIGVFIAYMNIYSLALMWYAPLYEMAYLQCAVAAAFYKFRRPWIYPLVFGAGMIGIFLTYHIQGAMKWPMPPIIRDDWIGICFIMFVIACFVQRFALGQNILTQAHLVRLTALGQDASRILHDVKGLASTPLLMSQKLGDSAARERVLELSSSIEDVHRYLKGTQRLVNVGTAESDVDVEQILNIVTEVLKNRLQGIEIIKSPFSKAITCNPNRLFSVFYNALLILIEAVESEKRESAKIGVDYVGGCIRMTLTSKYLNLASTYESREIRHRVISSDLLFLNLRGGFKGSHQFELVLA